MENKIPLYLGAGVGAAAVVYGMVRNDDVAFIIGVGLVVGAYLIFRKKFKRSIADREKPSPPPDSDNHPG